EQEEFMRFSWKRYFGLVFLGLAAAVTLNSSAFADEGSGSGEAPAADLQTALCQIEIADLAAELNGTFGVERTARDLGRLRALLDEETLTRIQAFSAAAASEDVAIAYHG